MPIQFQCPSCQTTLQVPDASAGKKAKCKCGSIVSIPAATAPSKPAATSNPAPAKAKAPSPSQPKSASTSAKAPKAAPVASNVGSLFDELTDKDWQAKQAVIPKADRGGTSDGAFLNAYMASAKNMEDAASKGPVPSGADRIRKEHLWHEAEVRAIGTLYYVVGVLYLIMGLFVLIGGIVFLQDEAQRAQGKGLLIMGGVIAVGAGITIGIGKGIEGLKGWGRIIGILLSALGAFGFPIGTLIHGYFLYLFLSKKGGYCYSEEYRRIVAATPQIAKGKPIWFWIFIGILVLSVLLGAIAGVIVALNGPAQ